MAMHEENAETNVDISDKIMQGILQKNFDPKVDTLMADCSICMAEFDEKDDVTCLPCNETHYFHTECVAKWIREGKNNCPLCRKVINEEDLIQK